MPAEAGIQSVGNGNNFKDLDSRLRGNDNVFPLATQSLKGEENKGEGVITSTRGGGLKNP
jgi:hypothetical protein